MQIFNSINSLEIKCENTFDKDEVIFFLRYCEIKKTAIREPNATISTIEETVRGIQISNNAEAFYLPIEVNTNFPNLELYDSWGCSIGEISRSNFEGLNKLTYLQLANNFIERIESETFVDLHALKHLNLGQENFVFHFLSITFPFSLS